MHKIRSKKLPEVVFLSLCRISRFSRSDYPATPSLNCIAWILWEGRWERVWKKTDTIKFKANIKDLELVPQCKLWCVHNIQTPETGWKSPKTETNVPIKPCIHLQWVLWNQQNFAKRDEVAKVRVTSIYRWLLQLWWRWAKLFLKSVQNPCTTYRPANIYRTKTSKNVDTDVTLIWDAC